jgi:hypothetical protein
LAFQQSVIYKVDAPLFLTGLKIQGEKTQIMIINTKSGAHNTWEMQHYKRWSHTHTMKASLNRERGTEEGIKTREKAQETSVIFKNIWQLWGSKHDLQKTARFIKTIDTFV